MIINNKRFSQKRKEEKILTDKNRCMQIKKMVKNSSPKGS